MQLRIVLGTGALFANAAERYELPASALPLAVCYAPDGCTVESVMYELEATCNTSAAGAGPDREHFRIWGDRVVGSVPSFPCYAVLDRNERNKVVMAFGDEVAVTDTEWVEGDGIRMFGISAYNREIPLDASQGMADYIIEQLGAEPRDAESRDDDVRVQSLNRWLITPRNVCYFEKFWRYGRAADDSGVAPPYATMDDWAHMDWIMADHGLDNSLHPLYKPNTPRIDGEVYYCQYR